MNLPKRKRTDGKPHKGKNLKALKEYYENQEREVQERARKEIEKIQEAAHERALLETMEKAKQKSGKRNSVPRPRKKTGTSTRTRILCPVPMCISNVLNISRHLRTMHPNLNEEEVRLLTDLARKDSKEAGSSGSYQELPGGEEPALESSDEDCQSSNSVLRMSSNLLKKYAKWLGKRKETKRKCNPLVEYPICSKVSVWRYMIL